MLGSNLVGTCRGPGADIAVIAGAGIINVDMVNIVIISFILQMNRLQNELLKYFVILYIYVFFKQVRISH